MGFLSNLFKKQVAVEDQKILPAGIDEEEINAEIEKLQDKLAAENKENEAALLSKLGSCYFKLKKTDEAIRYYELSLEKDSSPDEPRLNLLQLYNVKRRQAALDKNDVDLQKYLDKIDGLMKLNKEIIRKI